MELTKSLRQYPQESIMHDTIRDEPADYNKNGSDFPRPKKYRALKRIPLQSLMDLKIDYAFKQLFGSEKNKQITIVFLNEFLQKTGRDPIKDINFTNIEAGGEYVDDKQSRLDVLVVTTAGEKINVEIQFTDQYNMIKRSIYYWSGIYRSQLLSGMGYEELSDVISINLLNFNIFDQTERFHTMHHLFEDEKQFKLTSVMEFHYIEMPKLLKAWKEDQLDPWNDVLARWLLLLGMVDHRNKKFYEDIYHELEEIAMEDETLRKAFHNWEELSMTPEQFLAYESRLKHILDEEAAKREAELRAQRAEKDGMERGMKRGMEDGMKHGMKRGIEEGEKKAKKLIAQRLLSDGAEIQYVMDITGLSKEDVFEIQKDIME